MSRSSTVYMWALKFGWVIGFAMLPPTILGDNWFYKEIQDITHCVNPAVHRGTGKVQAPFAISYLSIFISTTSATVSFSAAATNDIGKHTICGAEKQWCDRKNEQSEVPI